ncbi:hypothetical protein JOF40_001248 [Aeromicrobium fastidiosum]|nr:hypothetical protein [Aeromicrobium fastidiosum]
MIICCECGRTREGTRVEARRAGHWEPYSTATQQLLDEGPMVCAQCVLASLDAELAAMRVDHSLDARTGLGDSDR